MRRTIVTAVCILALAAALPADRIARENIEWLDVWITAAAAEDAHLPRILLIGDSITKAYFPKVEQKIGSQCRLARLATSKSLGDPALLEEIALLLKQYKWDVIHFNNGMHGWGYTEEEYAKAFPQLLELFQKHAPQAKLIWATTTPVRDKANLAKLDPRTQRVKARNAIAAKCLEGNKIATDDLFSLVVDHPDYSSKDGVHFSDKGIAAQAQQVAKILLEHLPK